ncbi:DUF3592 domain-containing protein [Streptomyces sp. NPDC090741]|uniref:DUF3592 domain-containing protein n=1 Tax=Streptomyces sp. NPDC090741 TaxID=3365967 RepID=UPI003800A9D3
MAPASGAGSTSRSVGTTVYYPVITWSTGDGRAMETRTNIARPKDKTLPVGARVEVRYDQADPSRWTLPAEGTAFWLAVQRTGRVVRRDGAGVRPRGPVVRGLDVRNVRETPGSVHLESWRSISRLKTSY